MIDSDATKLSQPITPNTVPRERGDSSSMVAISIALPRQPAASAIGTPITRPASTPCPAP